MTKNVIETNNLCVFYGKHRGIVDVNLTVQEGEVYGFLGPNGAGKTTTLRVLLDVIRPSEGSASLFGLDSQKDGVEIRQRIGYIPGELALPDNLRGRQYLSMMDSIRQKKSDAEYRRQLAARFDLDVSRRIRQYSRGNKQKLALVSAFMHRPDLLILDEPTGGLDPLIQQAVLETVREAKDEGRTVFFSSHILPEVQAVCDRVGIIRDGRLIAVETINDLLQRRFHRLQLQFEIEPEAALFELDGVKLVDGASESAENTYIFEISDRMPEFMHAASQFGIIDIQVLDATLEEIFLAYYQL